MTGIKTALQDFNKAYTHALLEELLAFFTRRPASLLSYDAVANSLKARQKINRGLQDIPLDAIVGSVGRYGDFTRSFLPLNHHDAERWAGVEVAMTSLEGVPPIEVFKIGEAYFVWDGNHRVSVAKQLRNKTIEAYVTEVKTRVPLSPDVTISDLIAKSSYVDFLEQTNLDKLRPEADLSVSVPVQYGALLEQISVHHRWLQAAQNRAIPYEEAVADWYDTIYLPVINVIRKREVLDDFPGRTETDLYVWVWQHREAMIRELNWTIEPESAALDYVSRRSPKARQWLAHIGYKLREMILPAELETGPKPGQWRRDHLATHRQQNLFADILHPLVNSPVSRNALAYALDFARRDGGRLFGLEILDTAEAMPTLEDPFRAQCGIAGVPCDYAAEAGGWVHTINQRARWTDLIVLGLNQPLPDEPLSRLQSVFAALVRSCPRSILAVPEAAPPPSLRHILLAYNGSPKADEALFLATHMAKAWQLTLTIAIALDINSQMAPTKAQEYLADHQLEAEFEMHNGPVLPVILKAAASHHADLIVMGGYGHAPVIEVMRGSTVDEVIRQSGKPVLICR